MHCFTAFLSIVISVAANTHASVSERAEGAATIDSRPNILFIYLDDLDFDQAGLDCYPVAEYPSFGGAKLSPDAMSDIPIPEGWDPPHHLPGTIYTPNLNRLADEGAHLTRFYITSAMCTPSRYSLLTGRYAHRSDTVQEGFPLNVPARIEWNQYLDGDDDTLAKQLSAQGYTTAIVGKWHNGEPEAAHTPSVYRTYKHDPKLLKEKLLEAQEIGGQFLRDEIGFDFAANMSFDNADKIGGHNLPWHVEAINEFLAQSHEHPFFLYFPLPVPHGWGGGSEFPVDLLDSPAGRLDAIPDIQTPIDELYRRIRKNGASDRSITFTWIDDCIGKVLDALDVHGLRDNTLVIVTSDHQSRGKFSVYEGARVPFLARWPGVIEPGTQIDALAANIDIYPTLLELAGGTPASDLDGVSILPVLRGEEHGDNERTLLLETGYSKAILYQDYKYIANRPPQDIIDKMAADASIHPEPKDRLVGWDGNHAKPDRGLPGVRFSANWLFPHYFDTDQVYNLREDIFEQNNLYGSEPALDIKLRNALTALLQESTHPFGEFTD